MDSNVTEAHRAHGTLRRLGRLVKARIGRAAPPPGHVRLGDLRRTAPISRWYGFDRGQPIDRYYIEDFLRRHGAAPGYGGGDIQGRVLEVGGDAYTRQFGNGVSSIDVLHVDDSNPAATIVGDLATGEGLTSAAFDCVVCTQTLHVIYDVRGAIANLHRVLRPGGVALVTVAGITQSCRPDRDQWGDYWRFTSLSARRLFEEVFPAREIKVEAYGNFLASVAFLAGMSARELSSAELDLRDPEYEMLIAIRAVRES